MKARYLSVPPTAETLTQELLSKVNHLVGKKFGARDQVPSFSLTYASL